MFLYRKGDRKGLIRCTCFNCVSEFYISRTGNKEKYPNADPLYDIAQQLKTSEEVVINLTPQEYRGHGFDDYEFDNDYETNDILHLNPKWDISVRTGTPVFRFKKGNNYAQFMNILVKCNNKMGLPDKCPICGVKNHCSTKKNNAPKMSNLSRKVTMIFEKQIAANYVDKVKKEAQNDYIKQRPINNVKVDPSLLKQILRSYADTYINIRYFSGSLQSAYVAYLVLCNELKGILLRKELPDYSLLKNKPKQPNYLTPSLFNKKKVEAQNEALKAQYIQSESYIEYEQSLKQFSAAQRNYPNYRDNILMTINYQMEESDFSQYESDYPELVSKLNFFSDAVKKNEEILIEQIHNLKRFEETGILYPKYRNEIALNTFLEYLESGRCLSLEGPNGAYNLYEREILANRIIDRMDVVIQQLEQIKENQYNLYNAISEVNSRLSTIQKYTYDLVTSVDMIQQSHETIAYNSYQSARYNEVIANNTSITTFLALLNS